MTQNKCHKIKKNYQSPLITQVDIDNYITLSEASPLVPPESPGSGSHFTSSEVDDTEKELFPDNLTTDNDDPFGGSSPNYR
jgi:hypothetical protein